MSRCILSSFAVVHGLDRGMMCSMIDQRLIRHAYRSFLSSAIEVNSEIRDNAFFNQCFYLFTVQFFLYNSDRQERNILESLTYSARFDRGFILDEISCDECYYLNDSCFLRKDPRIISNVENLIH